MENYKRAWIEINRDNLIYNVNQFRKIIGDGCKLMPAIKANAYGHGDVEVASILNEAGVYDFCVASLDEGIRLRKNGIVGNILILGYTDVSFVYLIKLYDLTQTVINYEYALMLDDSKIDIKVHIAVDTGMHRLGESFSSVNRILDILSLKHLNVEGVFSHLCVSDSIDKNDIMFTKLQIKRFEEVRKFLIKRGYKNLKYHIQGSYGVLNYPNLKYDYARIGIALYGIYSKSEDKVLCDINLKCVMTLKSRVELVRDIGVKERLGYGLDFKADKKMEIAVVCIGYADGIPRNLSNRGYVLIGGRRAKIVGRICMDQLFVDVSNINEVKIGDEVVLIDENISVMDMADLGDTISNEIVSRLSKRVSRVII